MTYMDKACYERGCICYDAQDHSEYVEVVANQSKPLTDEQLQNVYLTYYPFIRSKESIEQLTKFARAIEAAHGIGENT